MDTHSSHTARLMWETAQTWKSHANSTTKVKEYKWKKAEEAHIHSGDSCTPQVQTSARTTQRIHEEHLDTKGTTCPSVWTHRILRGCSTCEREQLARPRGPQAALPSSPLLLLWRLSRVPAGEWQNWEARDALSPPERNGLCESLRSWKMGTAS